MDSLTALRNTNVGLDEPEGFQLSRTAGWTSVGFGLAELLAPRTVGSLMGLDHARRTGLTVRAFGVADLALGLATVMRPRRAAPLWARVAMDVVGLGFLAWAVRGKGRPVRAAAALAATAGVLTLDAYATQQVTRAQERAA